MNPYVEGKVPGWLVYAGCWAWSYLFCGYFCSAFVLLSFENSHALYSSMYYCGHIALGAAIAVCLALAPKRPPRDKQVAVSSDAAKKKTA